MGRRLWKDVGGSRTYYFYTDEGLSAEYDVAGNLIKSYGYEPDSTWGTNPLFQRVPTGIPDVSTGEEIINTYFYHNDHRGAPTVMTASNGAKVWEATYDSFGNINITTETVENNLRLPGQYFDSETGLYYNWNRYYDPTLGRYLRTDPEGEGLNHYAYVFANPHGGIDPMGLHTLGKVWDMINSVFETTAKWGQEALDKWMNYAINADSSWKKALGYGMAAFASLWTPDTWKKTLNVLLFASGINSIGKAAGWFRAGVKGEYAVYQSVSASGEVQYVGITNNLERRAAEHLTQKGISIDAIPGLSNLTKADARAEEQTLIETYKLSKKGGSLINKINSIARSNPNYVSALERGSKLLKDAKYPGF